MKWLIEHHFMLRTKEQYPKLHPTYEGNHFDENITKKLLNDLRRNLEDPNREVVEKSPI